jgi:hypothetical protein
MTTTTKQAPDLLGGRPPQAVSRERAVAGLDEPLLKELKSFNERYGRGIPFHLAYMIEQSDVDVSEFWQSVLGDDGDDLIHDHHFAHGFVQGTLAVWAKVKSKV